MLGGLRWIDRKLHPVLDLLPEPPRLLSFQFHGLYRDPVELASDHVHPALQTRVEVFERFIEYFRAKGYRFVGPGDVVAGLCPGGRYALISFDDGYASNVLACDILARHGVPAMFNVSTGYVKTGNAFWWDVVWRELRGQGVPVDRINGLIASYKGCRHNEIEEMIRERFGAEALRPRGAVDRPFTPDELASFARQKGVVLGNHTRDHAILTNYDAEGIRWQLMAVQREFEEMVGRAPPYISYPNGNYSPEVLKIAAECDFVLGISVNGMADRVPPANPMTLGRYGIPDSERFVERCDAIRFAGRSIGGLLAGTAKAVKGQT